ncbi:IS3 family transposase [Deinococcus sp. QL22]|uniref:IS3 family transposase n=1 Tax=Deinococcus sp. QL22 TaxID=2939437 RepID=UPI0035304D45
MDRIRQLAEPHPRRGSRFIHALLVKEGKTINRKRVRRIWRAAGLVIKKNPSRKIRTGNTIPMKAEFPNHVWTYDFIFDQTLGSTTLNILTLTDEFTVPTRWSEAMYWSASGCEIRHFGRGGMNPKYRASSQVTSRRNDTEWRTRQVGHTPNWNADVPGYTADR